MFVKTATTLAIASFAALLLATEEAHAKPISADAELSPELLLMIRRQEAQANQNVKADDYIKLDGDHRDLSDDAAGCGNVNIGNVHNENTIGTPIRPNVTIVTGNVVNLGDDDC